MATRNELYTALRNADKAGDTEGARKLAAYIQAMPEEPAASATPTTPAAKDGGIVDGTIALAGGMGKGFGGLVLGAQRGLGKWYEFLGNTVGGTTPSMSDLVTGNKPEKNALSRAGTWLVNDADAGRAKMTEELAPYKASNPLMAATGEVGGEILGTLPIGGAALKGGNALARLAGMTGSGSKIVGALPRAAQAAGIGAAYGGVLGAAHSTADTVGGTLTDSAKGAAASAALGGIASPVTGMLGAVAGNVKQRFSDTAAAEYAKQKIAQAFSRDASGELFTNGTLNPIMQIANRFRRLGDDSAVMADAGGKNTNALLDVVATLPGRTKQAVANLQHQRTATSGARLRTDAESALDTQGQRLASTIDVLTKRRSADAAPLYSQLRQVEVVPSSTLQDIVKAADQLKAVKMARDIATAAQQPFSLDVAAPAVNGLTNQVSKWKMGDLDHIKQGLDDLLKSSAALKSDGTVTSFGREVTNLRGKLVNELDKVTTDAKTGKSLYQAARNAYSKPTDLMDAAKAGEKAIRQDGSAIGAMVRDMGEGELQAFRIGAFEGLRNKLGSQSGQTEILNMWKNPSMQEKLRMVFGSQRAYREFAADVAREAQMKQIQTVGVGSQTAARHAGMGDLDLPAVTEAAHAASALKTGNVLSAIGSAKNAWNRVATPQNVRDQMGAMMLSRGPLAEQNMNALVRLTQQINDRNLLLGSRVGALAGQAGGSLSGNLSAPARIPQQ